MRHCLGLHLFSTKSQLLEEKRCRSVLVLTSSLSPRSSDPMTFKMATVAEFCQCSPTLAPSRDIPEDIFSCLETLQTPMNISLISKVKWRQDPQVTYSWYSSEKNIRKLYGECCTYELQTEGLSISIDVQVLFLAQTRVTNCYLVTGKSTSKIILDPRSTNIEEETKKGFSLLAGSMYRVSTGTNLFMIPTPSRFRPEDLFSFLEKARLHPSKIYYLSRLHDPPMSLKFIPKKLSYDFSEILSNSRSDILYSSFKERDSSLLSSHRERSTAPPSSAMERTVPSSYSSYTEETFGFSPRSCHF